MKAVTQSKLVELIMQIPEAKLQLAYSLLAELITNEMNRPSRQSEFMQMPLADRRKIMARQAERMVEYYESTATERLEWQSGDFMDDY